MSFINNPIHFGGTATNQINASLLLESDFDAEILNSNDAFLDVSLILQADWVSSARNTAAEAILDALIIFESDWSAERPNVLDAQLLLESDFAAIAVAGTSAPPPILSEIGVNAFTNQRLRTRFKINGVEVPIKSFEFSKPKGATGSSLNVVLAKADLALLPNNAAFSFEIGKFISGVWQYFSLLSNGVLDSRSYNVAFLNDTLSFSTVSPLADKLELCPRKNIICYDSAQVSLDLDESEPLFDSLGNEIESELRAVSGLSLYQLMDIAFVEGCGFASFQTNIPDFVVSRADFSFTSSYLDAVKGILGVFEPVLFAVGEVLWLLDKTQAIPSGFEPNELTASKMLTYGAAQGSQPLIDGFLVTYTDSESSANFSTNRLVQKTLATGSFGSPDFTETEITQTFRDWKHTDNPFLVVKSDLATEIEETYVNSALVGRTTENHFFDGQGKRTETRKTIESLVPDLISGMPSFLIVREEITEFFYKNDRFSPNRFVLDKTVLRVSGKIAKDSANQYFTEDFRQDFLEAHKAGNLAAGMSVETGAIKTVIEQFEQLGNGQTSSRTTTIDHLRHSVTNSFSDVKAGELGVNSISKPRQVVVWREGYNTSSTKGARIQSFAVGEVPLRFALPLAERRLKRQLLRPQEASITVNGFEENLERGIYFAVKGRNNSALGNFMTEGLTVRQSESQPIETVIEASEI